ncbi:hypothetical protein HHK36_015179 [Tetracentron sinense]|uniref:Uncharacterized protein n=1 Tax=Tetracentron sinense TaxID=13715 RepID=A0A834Z1J0_TETSI|nr:hypothetical protein HHK36_015179 [Tetracentron sinense]
MAWSKGLTFSVSPLILNQSPSSFSSSSLAFFTNSSSSLIGTSCFSSNYHSCCKRSNLSSSFPLKTKKIAPLSPSFLFSSSSSSKQICRAAEYQFPDPIPEFAEAETDKFRTHILKKLSKKDIYGDSIEEVVGICTEIFSTFLHTEYGGPGTLLVLPFIDMADTLNERGLPGGPQAARAAVVWAQDHVDKDWNEWTGGDSN